MENPTNSPNQNVTSIKDMQQLLIDMMNQCIKADTTDVFGGKILTANDMIPRGQRQIDKTTSTLPINENCALLFNISRQETVYKEIDSDNKTQTYNWDGEVSVLDLKTLQSVIGTKVNFEFKNKLTDSSANIKENNAEPNSSLEQKIDQSCAKDFIIFQSDGKGFHNEFRPNTSTQLNELDASNVFLMLNKHFNADLLAACETYKNSIQSNLPQVKANSLMMQMGLDGQILLRNEQIVAMAKIVGVSPHINNQSINTKVDTEVNSTLDVNAQKTITKHTEPTSWETGQLNLSYALNRRRLNNELMTKEGTSTPSRTAWGDWKG